MTLRLAHPPALPPTNSRGIPDAFDPHRPARSRIAPHARANPAQPGQRPPAQRAPVDAETIIARLEEAGQTLLCLPRSGPTTALRQTRSEFIAEVLDAYAATTDDRPRLPTPPAARITRMDQALAWIPLIPADKLVLRRIVGCRTLVSPITGRHLFSWRRLARLLGADHKAISRWHANGIDLIVTALNQESALVRSWDSLR